LLPTVSHSKAGVSASIFSRESIDWLLPSGRRPVGIITKPSFSGSGAALAGLSL
jgi:hypothetical protein